MLTCKICLREFKQLRYRSNRICICGRCTNYLNESKEVAQGSYAELSELLKTGMIRKAAADTAPNIPQWRQDRAQKTLANFEQEHIAALPEWTNRLVADPKNNRKIFKIIRAHRRGLLHYDRPKGWGYPSNWMDVAASIRALDGCACVKCGGQNTELHVHHIIYASNFGTHQKYNLLTLCRRCHEEEHKTVFDFGENMQTPDIPPTLTMGS